MSTISLGQGFSPQTTYPVGDVPFIVAVGDVNNDNKPDLVTSNSNTNNVSLLLGIGNGSFNAAITIPIGEEPQAVALGDVNGDNNLDIITANTYSDNVSVLLGTGTGSFSSPTNFPCGDYPYPVELGDVNGDGKLDIVISNYNNGGNTVSVLLNTGAGSFGAPTAFPTGGSKAEELALGDVNGDGKIDIVCPNKNSNTVGVLLGTGTGSFGPPTIYAVGSAPVTVTIGDVNGDGNPDIVTTNSNSDDVSVLLGTGTGSFLAATNYPVGSEPYSPRLRDVNGDGKLDIVTANSGSNNVSVLLGTGVGSFSTAMNYSVGDTPYSVQLRDVNGDGKPDIITANAYSNNVSVLLNQYVVSPTIAGFAASPNPVCMGGQITFTATISNVTGSYNYTLTNGTSATTGSSTNTSLSLTQTTSGSGVQSFSLIVSNNSQSAFATTDVTVNNLPAAGLSNNGPLSCTLTNVTLTASGGTSYTFVNSSGTLLPGSGNTRTVSSPGTYSVTVANANGCVSATSTTVSSNTTVPTATIQNPASLTLTCNTTSISLTATGGNTYRWDDNSTNAVRTVTASGTYSVIVTSANGCTAIATKTISSSTTPPAATILTPASTTLSCTTPTISLTATGGGTYRWDDNTVNPVRSVTSGGTYSVTITAPNGCTAATSQVIDTNTTSPTASILLPASATLTCSTTTLSLTATGGGTYRWDDNTTSAVRSVTSGNTYSVTVTAPNGCTSIASVQVFQDNSAPTVSITPGNATLTCATPTVSLSAIGTGTYLWNIGATTAAISVTAANTYSVTLTGTNGCTATASAVVSQDIAVPALSISPTSATLTCTNPMASLSAIGTGTYRWSTGATSQAISVSTATTYSVTLTGTNGCTATASASVTSQQIPPTVTISANPSLIIGLGQSTTLTASGASNYVWSTGAITPAILVANTGPYSVTGTAANGCTATASVTVTTSFAISSVIANTCQQIASNRYVISFTPVYAGTNGQPISFSVVNEVFPTTAPGPYTLQLYTDNPTITLKAQQTGTPGEVSYVYNWLAACSSTQPNTPPRVNQPLTDQIAKVGEGFGYTLPQVTFTDNESPQSLVLTVSGLPAGLSFSPPTQIGGVPTVAGINSVTVTATDPQGLSVSTSFVLTVVEPNASNTPPTLANPIPAQVGIQGQPFSLNVGTTFTDAQTPNGLVLTAGGLPTGLNLIGTMISGTPSVSGTSTVSLTAVDPGGLSATTSFVLTIQPVSVTASGPFAITGVNPITCTQVANNRYEISFTPRYSGVNGQAINFWVVNELVPTTAPGPYSLQLYNDNPVIVLKARQEGSAGETSFTYSWLANCGTPPQPNTPPRVNMPLTNQTARVGQAFGYSIPQLTFTDNETPQSLMLSVSGLPAGMSFNPPAQIGGVPSVSGVSTITVTATDPAGLSVSAQFSLTVLPATAPSGFAITGVQTVNCVSLSANRRSVSFTPLYSGLDGSPVSFSIVNELLPTTVSGPYTLELYTDNPTLRLRAQQGGSLASYDYNWLAACSTPARQGVAEAGTGLQVRVFGNPVRGSRVEIEVLGVVGQSFTAELVDLQGHRLGVERIERADELERLSLPIDRWVGIMLLEVRTASERQVIRLVQQ